MVHDRPEGILSAGSRSPLTPLSFAASHEPWIQGSSKPVGTWRSLVAHLHGVQGVASSNLAVPTNIPYRHRTAPFDPLGVQQGTSASLLLHQREIPMTHIGAHPWAHAAVPRLSARIAIGRFCRRSVRLRTESSQQRHTAGSRSVRGDGRLRLRARPHLPTFGGTHSFRTAGRRRSLDFVRDDLPLACAAFAQSGQAKDDQSNRHQY